MGQGGRVQPSTIYQVGTRSEVQSELVRVYFQGK